MCMVTKQWYQFVRINSGVKTLILQVAKPEDCARMCSAEKKCVGFVYTTATGYGANCWTKLKMCSEPHALKGFFVYRRSKDKWEEFDLLLQTKFLIAQNILQ